MYHLKGSEWKKILFMDMTAYNLLSEMSASKES